MKLSDFDTTDVSLYTDIRSALYVPAKLDALLPAGYAFEADDYDDIIYLEDRYLNTRVLGLSLTDEGFEEPQMRVHFFTYLFLPDDIEDRLCALLRQVSELGRTVSDEDKSLFEDVLPEKTAEGMILLRLRSQLLADPTEDLATSLQGADSATHLQAISLCQRAASELRRLRGAANLTGAKAA